MTHHDRQLAAFLARQLEPVSQFDLMGARAIALKQAVASALFGREWQCVVQLIHRRKEALAPCDRIQ